MMPLLSGLLAQTATRTPHPPLSPSRNGLVENLAGGREVTKKKKEKNRDFKGGDEEDDGEKMLMLEKMIMKCSETAETAARNNNGKTAKELASTTPNTKTNNQGSEQWISRCRVVVIIINKVIPIAKTHSSSSSMFSGLFPVRMMIGHDGMREGDLSFSLLSDLMDLTLAQYTAHSNSYKNIDHEQVEKQLNELRIPNRHVVAPLKQSEAKGAEQDGGEDSESDVIFNALMRHFRSKATFWIAGPLPSSVFTTLLAPVTAGAKSDTLLRPDRKSPVLNMINPDVRAKAKGGGKPRQQQQQQNDDDDDDDSNVRDVD
eukprot:jgi/Bigna1/83669/fgenesh1_pg.112_\